jgi:hypothetical protein
VNQLGFHSPVGWMEPAEQATKTAKALQFFSTNLAVGAAKA